MFYFNRFMVQLDKIDRNIPYVPYLKDSLYEHILISAHYAAVSNVDRAVFIAVLLHDICKFGTITIKSSKGDIACKSKSYINIINYFLTEDDPDYSMVCELIKYHMLNHHLKDSKPLRSFAEKTLLKIVHTHDASFMSKLFILYDCDTKGFPNEDPSHYDVMIRIMCDCIKLHAYNLAILKKGEIELY